MNIRNRALGALLGIVGLVAMAGPAAADPSFDEGPVSVVSSIRTETGHFDDYMAWLAGNWKKGMEAQKAAGIILRYNVYLARPRTQSDPDVYLVVTYKNMAAMDGLSDRVEGVMTKVMGTRAEMAQANADRGKIRTVLGSEVIREAVLK